MQHFKNPLIVGLLALAALAACSSSTPPPAAAGVASPAATAPASAAAGAPAAVPAVAAISGYFAVRFLMNYLQRGSLAVFAVYRFVLAAVILITFLRL